MTSKNCPFPTQRLHRAYAAGSPWKRAIFEFAIDVDVAKCVTHPCIDIKYGRNTQSTVCRTRPVRPRTSTNKIGFFCIFLFVIRLNYYYGQKKKKACHWTTFCVCTFQKTDTQWAQDMCIKMFEA